MEEIDTDFILPVLHPANGIKEQTRFIFSRNMVSYVTSNFETLQVCVFSLTSVIGQVNVSLNLIFL